MLTVVVSTIGLYLFRQPLDFAGKDLESGRTGIKVDSVEHIYRSWGKYTARKYFFPYIIDDGKVVQIWIAGLAGRLNGIKVEGSTFIELVFPETY